MAKLSVLDWAEILRTVAELLGEKKIINQEAANTIQQVAEMVEMVENGK
mgnify:CR=1 FL=1